MKEERNGEFFSGSMAGLIVVIENDGTGHGLHQTGIALALDNDDVCSSQTLLLNKW